VTDKTHMIRCTVAMKDNDAVVLFACFLWTDAMHTAGRVHCIYSRYKTEYMDVDAVLVTI